MTFTRPGSMEWVWERERGDKMEVGAIGNSFKELCHKRGTDNMPVVRGRYGVKERYYNTFVG